MAHKNISESISIIETRDTVSILNHSAELICVIVPLIDELTVLILSVILVLIFLLSSLSVCNSFTSRAGSVSLEESSVNWRCLLKSFVPRTKGTKH